MSDKPHLIGVQSVNRPARLIVQEEIAELPSYVYVRCGGYPQKFVLGSDGLYYDYDMLKKYPEGWMLAGLTPEFIGTLRSPEDTHCSERKGPVAFFTVQLRE